MQPETKWKSLQTLYRSVHNSLWLSIFLCALAALGDLPKIGWQAWIDSGLGERLVTMFFGLWGALTYALFLWYGYQANLFGTRRDWPNSN
jgi:hypothetical protein